MIENDGFIPTKNRKMFCLSNKMFLQLLSSSKSRIECWKTWVWVMRYKFQSCLCSRIINCTGIRVGGIALINFLGVINYETLPTS